MNISFLAKLACPFDKQDLTIKIHKQEAESILEGILTCTHCNRYYPIVHGIPVMTPDEYRESDLERPILEKWGEQLLLNETGESKFQLLNAGQLVK